MLLDSDTVIPGISFNLTPSEAEVFFVLFFVLVIAAAAYGAWRQ